MSILLMEPDSNVKRRRFSDVVMDPKSKPGHTEETAKSRLSEIRQNSLSHLDRLIDGLTDMPRLNPQMEISFAENAGQAIETINSVSRSSKIAVNKSSVIGLELAPHLKSAGFRVLETYYDQFESSEVRFNKAWRLPGMDFESALQSFEGHADLGAQRKNSVKSRGCKDFTGLVGISSLSVRDGSALLLQHMRNISSICMHANKLVLVAALDKMVYSLDDALFMTKCMGAFGARVVSLMRKDRAPAAQAIDQMDFDVTARAGDMKIQLIILDNGRSSLLRGPYREILTCIGCRACIKGCPSSEFFETGAFRSPREYLFSFLTGRTPALDLCMQCKSCKVNCPLSIDLPEMILKARTDNSRRSIDSVVFSHAEEMAKMSGRMSSLMGKAMRNKTIRKIGERTLNISERRELPEAQRETFEKWFRTIKREKGENYEAVKE